MADDNSVTIELKANTAAAVTEVSKLSEAMRGATTAATAAGSAQEQLGKDVAVTKARQAEATEAVRAAKQALDVHKDTVAAFGVKSEQAAQSAAKLAAAEREAAKAATVAAEALARTAAEAQAVAASEKELSPATKRAAAEISRMGAAADKTQHELTKMELSQKKGSAGFDLMGMAGGKLMSVLGPAALGGTLVALAGWLGETAEKTLQYETALANLPYTIDGARKSTRGLVSDQALVAAAANASALGVAKTSEQFAGLAAATAKLAKPGQDVNALLNEITGALGRGSSESLNNVNVILTVGEAQRRYAESIGVTVASLTDEQKATAFKVEGLKAVIAAADETTIAYDGNAAALVRLKVAASDTWDAMTRAAANGAGATVKALGEVSGALFHDEEWISMLVATATAMDTTWSPAMRNGASAAAMFAADLLLAGDAYEVMAQAFNPATLSAMDAANAKEREKRDILSEEAAYSERMAKAIADSEKASKAFVEAAEAADMFIGPAEAPKKKKTGARKKPRAEVSSLSDRGGDYDGVAQIEASNAIAGAAPEAAAAGRAEQEAALFAQAEERYRREAELLDAQGQREAERIDGILFSLDIEDEAETRRRELQDQRLGREEEYARWQARNARNETQREQAQTRLEDVEHRKRIVALTRAAEQERKVLEQRRQLVGTVTGAVTDLASSMVGSIEAAVNGQRGALARGLADWTKDLAVRSGLKALEEFMLAAASAASYNFPAAAAHTTAGGMALAVAAAAGGASAGLGAAASAAERGGAGGGPGRASGAGSSGGAPGGGSGGGQTSNLERMDVPVSYDRAAPAGGLVVNINVTGPVGKDTLRAIGETVRRATDKSKAQGPRP